MTYDDRFDRNERLFGKDGQARLRGMRVFVAGAGGLGSHVVQQIALLGVGAIDIADQEELSRSNRNRYIGAWYSDPVPGTPKVDIAERLAGLIDPTIRLSVVDDDIVSEAGLEALKQADLVFGCVDNDGVRFFLNEASLAYNKPLIDLASDVPEPGVFGGRIALITGEHGCLHCLEVLDGQEVRRFLSGESMLANEAAEYGVDVRVLSEAGPSVVSVNGVVASLGVTAFMAWATDLKMPYRLLNYRGDRGTVTRQLPSSSEDCFYCNGVRGAGDRADLLRYVRARRKAAAYETA